MSLRMFSAAVSRGAANAAVRNSAVTTQQPWKIIFVRGIQISSKPMGDGHVSGFSPAGMKKNYAVIPMVVICVGAVVGVIGYSTYSAFSRTDVVFSKHGPMSDHIDLKNPPLQKMYDVKPGDLALPDVANLYLEMETAAKELEKKNKGEAK